jgi:Copper type II ascorbate-dependent monooxygenase, N-terminal domain/Copper type II ascorbate-dependent monooxygenase, C-terminal domain
MRSMRRAFVLGATVLLLAACGGGGSDDGPPSFVRDVAPILQSKCASCHRDGGIAPFSLESAQTAKAQAGAIAALVESRLMPPWPPGPASPDFAGQEERTLSAEQIETVMRWARSGASVDGAALKAPAAEPPRAEGDERVVELTLPDAYTPSGETDDYRCFLLDPELADDAFVTSAVIRPGAPRVVHHVILFRAEPNQVDEAARLDAEHEGQGWPCFGGTGLDVGPSSLTDAGWIAAWAPGGEPVRYPAGTGSPLAAGSGVVMQVHYNLLNGRSADRTAAVLTVAPGDSALEPAQTMLLPAPIELACADGERGPLCDRDAALADLVRRHGGGAAFVPTALLALCGRLPVAGRVSSCERGFDERTTIHGVAGHMHLLGRSIRVELNPGTDDARVLLDIPRWDFHWQNAYMLEDAIVAEPGDRVRVTCRHDVSSRTSEPRYVLWGEGTSDEMCLGVLQVTRGSG